MKSKGGKFKKNRKQKKKAPRANITNDLANYFDNYVSNLSMSRKLGMPIPDAFRTTLRMEWSAYHSASTPSTINYQILASTPERPLNPTNYSVGGIALASPPGTAVGQGSILVANKIPSGYFLLQSPNNFSLYGKCHVLNARCSVRYTPLALNDSLSVCIYPGSGRDTRLVTLTGDACQQPRAHSKAITSSNSSKEATVSCSINCAEREGVPLVSWIGNSSNGTCIENNLGTPTLRVPSDDSIQFFSVCVSSADGDVFSVNVPYKITLEYDVLFHNPPNQIIN